MSENPSLSVSSLKVYEKCPEQYRRKYIERDKGIKIPKDYFILGRLTHKILENKIQQDLTTEDAFALAFPIWLEEEGFNIEKTTSDMLFDYAEQYGFLLHRASPVYLLEDKFRKKDGSLLADAYRYPSKELRDIYLNEDLDITKQDLDDIFARKYTLYQTLSLADCVARAYCFAMNFQTPDWLSETVGMEIDIGQEEKLGSEVKYFRGYIDWVCRVNLEGNPLAIFDFKTGKTIPTEEEVIWDTQLNLYALLYYTKFNEFPSYIGIYHLPTGKAIPVEVSSRVINQITEHYGKIIDSITFAGEGEFPKRFPTEYNSPCATRDWKSKAVTDICPYLNKCWPDYYNEISDEELIKTVEEARS